MNDRLLQFLRAENISQTAFADNIGITRASVSHILSGRNKPGFDFLEKILAHYPQLNAEWLITGKGRMYKTLGEASPTSLPGGQAGFGATRPETWTDTGTGTDTHHETGNGSQSDPGWPSLFDSQEAVREEAKQERQPLEEPPLQEPAKMAGRTISKIIVLYDDNSFEEYAKGL